PYRCDLTVEGTEFYDLVGPALYLWGRTDTVMRGCDVHDTGTPPFLAGGVMALDGVLAPDGAEGGLVLEGNRFHDIGGDVILLDASGAELRSSASLGPNTFSSTGPPLFRQRCGPETFVLDGSEADGACRATPRPLGPPLEHYVSVVDADAIE
ncbi:MAG: right-handed parallel beta-helix repeat-containing protein, partial [Deltaproteobacteria bacterium]|nr:right-handed parallel beta-helix repeat-containing protein [Deltaproteobacteria bacterium]